MQAARLRKSFLRKKGKKAFSLKTVMNRYNELSYFPSQLPRGKKSCTAVNSFQAQVGYKPWGFLWYQKWM